jgi:hypothetical protein
MNPLVGGVATGMKTGRLSIQGGDMSNGMGIKNEKEKKEVDKEEVNEVS